MSRPSETITGIVGSVVGALVVVLGWVWPVEIPTEVVGAITVLVSWIAALVTWWIANRQRKGELASAPDGTVKEVQP